MASPDLMLLDENAQGGLRRLAPGIVNLGFSEIQEARFLKVGEGWTLFVDDAPLPTVHRDGRDIWLWRPGFYAGTVRAELLHGQDKVGITYLLDVSPDPGKVGQEQFLRMVREVWSLDPALVVGEESATTRIGQSGEQEDPAIRYMRLSTYAEALILSSSSILRNPHRTIHAARYHVPLHRVRRADLQTATAAMVGEAALMFMESEDDSEFDQVGAQPLFDVPFSEETFDSAANRTMAALLMLVVQSIDAVGQTFESQLLNEQDEDTRQARSQRWPRRQQILGELRLAIKRVLGRDPFDSVSRKEVTAAGLTAIASHPLYARAQQLIWKMIRPGYQGATQAESSAMSPTWAIYESWCFASLSSVLQHKFPDWQWTRSHLPHGRHCLSGHGDEQSVELHFQQMFSYSETPPVSGFWSISSQLIPDIVLLARNGKKSSWVVLDAKYRRGRRNVLDGMRSAHIYRDALRHYSSPPALSLLLIPAPPEDTAWILTEDFKNVHGVGALVYSPDHVRIEGLTKFMDEFFA